MARERYDDYGPMGMRRGPATQAEKDAVAARVARMDAEHAAKVRSSLAFDRLCGMAAPIGGPASR